MEDIPSRPTATKEMVLSAIKPIADGLEGDAETIADHYRHPMDGYELARDLDRYCLWDLTFDDVETLDGIRFAVDRLLREAEKEWANKYYATPPLPIGTEIKQGIIEGVCAYSEAKYLVKEHGCNIPGRWILVNFEKAQYPNDPPDQQEAA